MVLVAFAVERVTSGVLFLLSFHKGWRRLLGGLPSIDQKPASEERRYKLAYFALASIFALFVLLASRSIRVLSALGMGKNEALDIGLTLLVLVAGSDRIGDLVQEKRGSPAEKPSKPVQIEGTLTIKDDRTKHQAA
jgi:hypothetical protein